LLLGNEYRILCDAVNNCTTTRRICISLHEAGSLCEEPGIDEHVHYSLINDNNKVLRDKEGGVVLLGSLRKVYRYI